MILILLALFLFAGWLALWIVGVALAIMLPLTGAMALGAVMYGMHRGLKANRAEMRKLGYSPEQYREWVQAGRPVPRKAP